MPPNPNSEVLWVRGEAQLGERGASPVLANFLAVAAATLATQTHPPLAHRYFQVRPPPTT